MNSGDHDHGDHARHCHGHHHHHGTAGRTLGIALVLTLGFSVVEFVAGWRAGSLALLADSGRMVSDGAALGLSALAASLAARPPSRRHTYGLGKAELLAALVNALSMLAVVLLIGMEAWRRLQAPAEIDGERRRPGHRRPAGQSAGRLGAVARRAESQCARGAAARHGRCAGIGGRHRRRRGHLLYRLDADRPAALAADRRADSLLQRRAAA